MIRRMQQVIDFFAPAGGKSASVSDILGGLHGPASRRQRQAATDIFRVLDRAGTGVLTPKGLKKSLGDVCTGYVHIYTGKYVLFAVNVRVAFNVQHELQR